MCSLKTRSITGVLGPCSKLPKCQNIRESLPWRFATRHSNRDSIYLRGAFAITRVCPALVQIILVLYSLLLLKFYLATRPVLHLACECSSLPSLTQCPQEMNNALGLQINVKKPKKLKRMARIGIAREYFLVGQLSVGARKSKKQWRSLLNRTVGAWVGNSTR